MKARYLELVEPFVAGARSMDLSRSFDELGVDSFDLLAIRVDFERLLNREIPDREWTHFASFDHLFAYADRVGLPASQDASSGEEDATRYFKRFEINMPQMALESLSESWLFKELGAAHWELLCRGLGERSSELKDELGNRLYATFARVQHTGAGTLAQFSESERVELTGHIFRYGGGMYYSEFELKSLDDPGHRIDAHLITSFSRRGETGNRDLVKSQPVVAHNAIESLAKVPPFIDEYRLVKKGELDRFDLADVSVSIGSETTAEWVYELNPYHDLNGVGLLYFAAYPIIADTCEASLQNSANPMDSPRWEQRWRTVSRDVMYYGNCDISDAVVYRLHSLETRGADLLSVATLSRRSDRALMARVATVKRRLDTPPPPAEGGT